MYNFLTLSNGTSNRLNVLVPEYYNRYFQNVLLTLQARLRTNLSVTWTADKNRDPEMVAIISNQKACRARLREYSRRMSIEQSFRDDKSRSFDFDLEHIRLQHVKRADRLLLAIAIATLWCQELGEFVLKQGEDSRCRVDPSHTHAQPFSTWPALVKTFSCY